MRFPSVTTDVGDFSYEAEHPQPEDFAEAVEFCGGETGALNVLRAYIKQGALQGPKDKVRRALQGGADPGSDEFLELLGKQQEASRNYQPTGRRVGSLPGGATKRQASDAVAAMADADPEAFAELLEKYGQEG